MTRYFIRRLISVIPTLLGVTIVIFLLLRLIPGDPAVAMLGEHAAKDNVERIREQLGLNRPLFLDVEALKEGDFEGFFDSQYARYLGRLARGEEGPEVELIHETLACVREEDASAYVRDAAREALGTLEGEGIVEFPAPTPEPL